MEIALGNVGKRGAVIFPSKLRKLFGIDEGSLVAAEAREGGIPHMAPIQSLATTCTGQESQRPLRMDASRPSAVSRCLRRRKGIWCEDSQTPSTCSLKRTFGGNCIAYRSAGPEHRLPLGSQGPSDSRDLSCQCAICRHGTQMIWSAPKRMTSPSYLAISGPLASAGPRQGSAGGGSPANVPDNLNVTWVTRSFVDYRVPVFASLNELTGGRLTLLYSADSVPQRVREKVSAVLGSRAVGLTGEWSLGPKADDIGLANSSVSIVYQPGVLRHIWRARPDVLVGDGFFKWTTPALIASVIKRVPLVLCYERTQHTERNCQWYRTVYRRAVLRFVDAMCCNGQASTAYMRSLGMNPARITLKNMVADVDGLVAAAALLDESDRTAIRRDYGIEGVCFLYSGRLTPRKGVLGLVGAWRRHEATHPNPGTLVLVGEGPEEASLRALVSAHGLQRVRFVGSVDYDVMHRYYRAADVFVIATLEDNWSLVVPEAMACGLPILSSRYNGCCPELVRPGRNGYVFDPMQPASLTALFGTCCARSGELSSMGRESQRIVSDYTPEAAAKEILRACAMARGRRSTEGVTR